MTEKQKEFFLEKDKHFFMKKHYLPLSIEDFTVCCVLSTHNRIENTNI